MGHASYARSSRLTAVRFGLQNIEFLEFPAQIIETFFAGRRQRRAVGPTGRPIMIIAPFSDEGYCSLNSRHSRATLYWHSRALSQSLATSAA